MSDERHDRPAGARPAAGLRLWHLALLVVLVAVAIANIQDQRVREPALVALACLGFVGYGIIGWLGWRVSRRVERRLGPTTRLVLFLAALAFLFFLASVVYVSIEYAYHAGPFPPGKAGSWIGARSWLSR